VPYREYWHWTNLEEQEQKPEALPPAPPVRLFTPEDEAEIERLFQTLKTGGRLDSHTHTIDPSPTSGAKTSGED
jgi:hypothetical protein